jgi:hypothetical protein
MLVLVLVVSLQSNLPGHRCHYLGQTVYTEFKTSGSGSLHHFASAHFRVLVVHGVVLLRPLFRILCTASPSLSIYAQRRSSLPFGAPWRSVSCTWYHNEFD